MANEREYDVAIVGGGPAGLAAAATASVGGRRVAVLDDNPSPGGQIWRGATDGAARSWFGRVRAAGVEFLAGTRLIARPEPGVVWAESSTARHELLYKRLILATGARERFLPFPGWTLPNVLGAGGLQALVKGGWPVAGRRVVVAGSGPLLLAVATYLRGQGAVIPLVAEQASRGSLLPFALELIRHPSKIAQAWRLRSQLRGVPHRFGVWPSAAHGDGKLESVTLTDGRRTWEEPCDYLACGFGLVPNTEAAALLGCEIANGAVRVDQWQQTTVAGVYAAGEATGIGGVEAALVEGEIAGHAAAGNFDEARRLFGERRQARRFAAALERAFAPREELRNLPRPETVVCRCEDVTWRQLAAHDSWRAAKLQTRCGMGPCQGRVCGAALAFLRGWRAESLRPPLVPARVESLA
jgi:NADPH-dependent 2,4-dienoyl-CoA reductase/sulfur reductase-like enzyme